MEKIGIIGAGTMGQGIAQVAAMAGHPVFLFDTQVSAFEVAIQKIQKNLNKAVELGKSTPEQADKAQKLISKVDDLKQLHADVIIEAVVEKLGVKQSIFQILEEANGENTILATNTSSIPITRIANGLKRPQNVVGMHFFNPAHIMKLVEVISGESTDPQVAQKIFTLAKSWGKTAVMAKDDPGFIVNRVARHFYVESLKIAEEGVADFKTIDRLVESMGFKMGPFRLMDLIGVDTNFSVTTAMFESFHYDPKFRPSRIQQKKVEAGHWGVKTGRGFYDYEKKD
jgi:3-hydroxybutyryl-CoA dehydrogenase